MDLKNYREIFQDTFFFTYILEYKILLKGEEEKLYFVKFLKYLSAINLFETIKFLDQNKLCDKSNIYRPGMLKEVKLQRDWIKQRAYNSSSMNKKTQTMGIDFSRKIYDINIVTMEGVLFDLNFEDYNENNELWFWDEIFKCNKVLQKVVFDVCKIENKDIEKLFNSIDKEFERSISSQKLNFTRYSYSSFKLFSRPKGLVDDDKKFILYRFRVVNSVLLVEEIFNNLNMKLSLNALEISLVDYFRKVKSFVVCLIGEDLKNANTLFSKQIEDGLELIIKSKDFYKINRKQRNNLHYDKVDELTESEKLILDEYQNKYLNYIKNTFDEQLYFDVDEKDIEMTNFFKFIQEKNYSSEYLKDNYVKTYLEYLSTL